LLKAVLHVPAIFAMGDQARFDVLAAGQVEQFLARQGAGSRGWRCGSAGLLVPVVTQELGGRDAAEQIEFFMPAIIGVPGQAVRSSWCSLMQV
jgi:hypothetical protein